MEAMKQSVQGSGGDQRSHKLYCDLLVVEPDHWTARLRMQAFRLDSNPQELSANGPTARKKLDLPRLMGYLVQEEILRSPGTIEVQVAEIVPG